MDGKLKDEQNGNSPRHVIRGVNSHLSNVVGVHWLRISFNRKDLTDIRSWVSNFWGDSDQDGFGLWSYDTRFHWPSGVSLNFDSDLDRSNRVHRSRVTLEVPGKALDQLTAPDLTLFVDGCNQYGGLCTRIDVFFDDYARIVSPSDLREVIEHGDYSGFNKAGYRPAWDRGKLYHDEAWFGRRGDNGSGKYLRVYDKNLESEGENDCVRWEVEFSQSKAREVFMVLAGCEGDIQAFTSICGALVAGCINFVHRTGDKNLSRLEVHNFWQIITERLGGKLRIRTEKKVSSITNVIEWTETQVAPSLACISKAFKSDQDFYLWLRDILDDGDSRLNAKQRDIVKECENSMSYRSNTNKQQDENEYVRRVLPIDEDNIIS